jgi:hypothetical protein
MPKKIQDCTKAHLISIDLPVHGDSYTVISHESVMDYVFTELATAGFVVTTEEYRATADGQIAQGIYRLNYNSDPELNMMFAWTNSYNKQVRFKCGVGAYVNQTGTVMVCGDMGSWARKHTGSADAETIQTIKDQITDAKMYYNQLVTDKEAMKGISMTKRKQAQMLGILFAEYQILTTEQASMIRSQMDKPNHVFTDSNSLWAFYNYVTIALQHSHPKTWMEDQRVLHYFISSINNFGAAQTAPQVQTVIEAAVDPLTTNYGQPENQLNILTELDKIEAEESSLEPELDLDEVVRYEAEEIIFSKLEEETVIYTDTAGNTFEAIDFHNAVTKDPEEEEDEFMNVPLEEEVEPFRIDENQEWTGENAATMSLEPTPEEYQIIEEELAEEANLDLLQPVIQVKEKEDVADFDLDFTSSVDVEEDDNEIADFF